MKNFTFRTLQKNIKKILSQLDRNMNTRRHELFNYENTPDMEVWKAS